MMDATFDTFFWVFFVAIVAYVAYSLFTKRGKGRMFGGEIIKTLLPTISKRRGMMRTNIKVHLIKPSDRPNERVLKKRPSRIRASIAPRRGACSMMFTTWNPPYHGPSEWMSSSVSKARSGPAETTTVDSGSHTIRYGVPHASSVIRSSLRKRSCLRSSTVGQLLKP